MIKVNYNEKVLKQHLVLAILWFAIAIVSGFFGSSLTSVSVGFYLASISYIVIHVVQKKRGYVVLKDGELTIRNLIPKKIEVADVIQTRRFAGDLILKSKEKEVKIDLSLVNQEEMEKLQKELNRLMKKKK